LAGELITNKTDEIEENAPLFIPPCRWSAPHWKGGPSGTIVHKGYTAKKRSVCYKQSRLLMGKALLMLYAYNTSYLPYPGATTHSL